MTSTDIVRELNAGSEDHEQVTVCPDALHEPLKFAEYVPSVDADGALKESDTLDAALLLLL